MAEVDVAYEGVINGGAADEDVVAVEREVVAGDATAAGCVALRVCINKQRALFSDGEGGGEIYRGGGFTDSTFLIGDSEDACQGRSARRVRGDR